MDVFSVDKSARVYAYSDYVSMAYGFPRLSEIVEKKLKRAPTSGDLFLFHNKNGNRVKVLYFDSDGLCIWSKVLLKGKFDCENMRGRMNQESLRMLVNSVLVVDRRKSAKAEMLVIKRKAPTASHAAA